MGVMLYKKEGDKIISERYEVKHMQSGIAAGWSVDPECRDKSEAKDPEAKEKEVDEKETIRKKAKDAGIEGWDSKRIKTLKAELGLNDGVDNQD